MIISIIIPVYNVEKYIERCVRSCEAQDVPSSDYEVICVNDGSQDNSLQIIRRLASEYDNILVIDQPNGGLSSARNTGVRNAKGMYYMFVDSDDWIKKNCLGHLSKILLDESPDALAICAADIINDTPVRRQSYPNTSPISGRDFLKSGVSPCAPFSIWSADLFRNHNLSFFEGIYHEDAEFTPRAYYFAEKISFTNEIVYFVYPNPQSITRSINPKKSFDLVNVVCVHLSEFARNVDDGYKNVYYNLVGLYLNNAMANVQGADGNTLDMLNEAIFKRSFLWKDILKSKVMKYKIEAVLALLFPRKPLTIYSFLLNFKPFLR